MSQDETITPPCPYFKHCGVCHLMDLPYKDQLKFKQRIVEEAFQGKQKVLSCTPAPLQLHYRNKIQCPVRGQGPKMRFGFYAPHSIDLVDIDTCLLHVELGESILQKTKEFLRQSNINGYDPLTNQGELRHILIKVAPVSHEALVAFITNGSVKNESFKNIALKLCKSFPEIKGVLQNINNNKNNIILGSHSNVLVGEECIEELICGLRFKISIPSFFQVNLTQAENLYKKALEFAALSGNETVLDAFCGVGTLTLMAAQKAKKILGIEQIPEAIYSAKLNAKLNGIQNISFICGNAENFVQEIQEIDVAFVNPPRKGCSPKFLKDLCSYEPKKIIYISCNPTTLAKDCSILQENGYQIENIQPFDMFPQTKHVECVVKLLKTPLHRI